ncbi:LysE family translocator [Tatumella sp. UBA2305]|uniref:LysE family translocator n=1 Tax=Tatumella sp. UBA2305 TaxID=1947647 RepID=UPI0039C8DB3D
MNSEMVLGFWMISLLLSLTPGADWAYVIASGIDSRKITAAVCGLMSGHFLALVIVIAGVGGMVASHPAVLNTLTLAGSAYLFWLGYNVLHQPADITSTTSSVRQTQRQWATRGLCISGLNPKVFLLFLALLPQFIRADGQWPVSLQLMLLGGLHLVSCSSIYFGVGYTARGLLSTRPQAARIVSKISGGTMIVVSLILLAEQLHSLS